VIAIIVMAAVPALLAIAACCFRISEWHRQEADYWYRIALLVQLNPALDAVHRPVLDWTRANRPSVFGRLCEWLPPDLRMKASS
jgi:hypothetical protein